MKTTRYEQVANRVLNLIQNGVFKPGDKVPSIRQLSKELHVSINTVKEAYWRLENQNHIIAVPQSGFFVKRRRDNAHDQPIVDPSQWDPQKVSLCQVFGAFQNMGRVSPEVSLGIASLDPDVWPAKRIGRYVQEAVRDQRDESYNYLMPPGYLPLREQIALHGLAADLDLAPDDIIITNGCHEAIFLALMAICKPGDTVVFESPIYFNLLQLLEQLNLNIIEIPSSPDEGIQLDTLRFVLDNHPVKAMFSISNFNNPVGFLMPGWKKKQLVELLSEKNIPLVEDDIYGDLSFERRPDTCKSYDRDGNVVLCSSFSKTIAPGLRIGWIVPGKFRDKIIKLKTLLNISTSSINQIAVARFLKEGGYERHLRMLSKILQEQVSSVCKTVLKKFPEGTTVTRPKGGLLLWVSLPETIDAMDIYRQTLAQNIVIAPGCLFTMKDNYHNCLRLNAGIWNSRVEKAIEYIGEVCMNLRNPN